MAYAQLIVGGALLGSPRVRCRAPGAGRGSLPGLLLRLLFGFGQHARGAHFASHTLWPLAVGWFLPLALYHFCGGRAGLGPRPLNAGRSVR